MKKRKLKTRLIINILLLILGLSTGYFIYNILLFKDIENTLRYLFIAFLVIVYIIFIVSSFGLKDKGKFKKTFYFVIMFLLIGVQPYLGHYIGKVYTSIDNINKDTIIYSTSIITLKDSKLKTIDDLDDNKLGMYNDTSSIEGYEISKEIISEEKLTKTNNINEYEDYFSMLNDLYAGKLDAVFVPTGYVAMFSSVQDFEKIESETKIIYTKEKEEKKKRETASSKKLTEPFTVLVMGIDSIASDIKNATSNGDSLMVITFNPKTLNATILSIPRDTYVPIACFAGQRKNKITHAGWHGEECMEETIENFTGIDIDYYVKVDFKGVVDLVEILDGINVNVPMKFCEQNSARSYANEICLKPGLQTLNGEEALALARHRHSLATGDLQRGLNQQLVVEGILAQLKNVKDVNALYNILDAMEKHMDTNLSTSQILSLYNVGKEILASGSSNTNSVVSMQQLFLQTYGAMIYEKSFGKALSSQIYYQKSLEAVTDSMKVNLGIKDPTLIKTFSFSINTVYEKEIIGKGLTGGTSFSMMPNLVGKSKTYVQTWAGSHNVNVTYKYEDKTSGYNQDQVISQSVHANTDLGLVSSLTITLANVPEVEEEEEVTYCLITDHSQTKTEAEYEALTPEEKDLYSDDCSS